MILLAAIGGMVVLLAAGATVASAEPAYDVEPPEVELAPGGRLVCSPGSWEGAGIQFTYTWLRDGSAFAKGSLYILTNADKGHTFTCIVLGRNSQGEEEEESWNAYQDGEGSPKPPAPTSPPPEVSGTPEIGNTLECKPGGWSGTPPLTFSYQWLRENLPIGNASSGTYTVQKEDAGYSLSCTVTATNTAGSASKQSSNSLQVKGSPPSDVTSPHVLGTGAVGQQLRCAHENWNGAPPPTFTYRWLRDSKEVAGAMGESYTIGVEDQTHRLACEVTAENAFGKAKAKSSNEVEVPGTPPSNTELPKATGAGKVGSPLTCEHGGWSGAPSPTFKYQWLRNDIAIPLATASTYTVAAQDEGRFISCQVTASNGVGNPAVAVSNAIGVEGEPSHEESVPVSTELPKISGEPSVGNTLTCSTGKWYAEPPVETYSYQWLRGGSIVATASTYKVENPDRGLQLECRVKAKNSVGTGNAESQAVQVKGVKPTVGPPTLFGAHVVGETLTCAPGAWEGIPKPTFSYRWLGGTVESSTNSYVIQKEDKGRQLVCEITATNFEGSASAKSATVEVPAVPPKLVHAPSISGQSPFAPGTTLTCSSEWSGEPKPTISYVWLTDGGPIEGANSSTYVVRKFDQGHLLACEAIASNPAGQERAISPRVHIVGSPPELVEEPRVTGEPQVGEELRCEPGVWRGKPSPSLKFQWLLNGSEIADATEETYIPGQEELGSYISCAVTATNTEGSYEAWSENDPQIVPRSVRKLEVSSAPAFTKEGTSKPPTAAQIRAALEKQLSAALKKARRSGLLKKGSYSFSFTPPTGGKLEFLWYQTSKVSNASSKAKAKPKPLLLARVRSTFGTVSAQTQKLRLTIAGRRVLKDSKHPKLTVKGVFIPAGGTAVSWSKTVVLTG